MPILDIVLNPKSTLQQLLDEAKQFNAEIIQAVQGDNDPYGAVIIVRGSNTKAYLQALNRIAELLDEDSEIEEDE
jgi:hypothetical protein